MSSVCPGLQVATAPFLHRRKGIWQKFQCRKIDRNERGLIIMATGLYLTRVKLVRLLRETTTTTTGAAAVTSVDEEQTEN